MLNTCIIDTRLTRGLFLLADVLDAMPWLVSTVHKLDSAYGDWGTATAETRKAGQKKKAKRQRQKGVVETSNKQPPSLLNTLIG